MMIIMMPVQIPQYFDDMRYYILLVLIVHVE